MFFENSHRHLYFVEVLVVLSYVIRKGSDTIKYCGQYNYAVFSALGLLRAMCEEKKLFLKFNPSFTTFYATIAWMENGVS